MPQPLLRLTADCSASGTPRPPARFIETRSRNELTTWRKSRRRSLALPWSCSVGSASTDHGARRCASHTGEETLAPKK